MIITQILSMKNVKNHPARLLCGLAALVLALLWAGCEGNNPAKTEGNGEPSPVTLANLEEFMVPVEGGAFTIGCRGEEYGESASVIGDVETDTVICLPSKDTTVADFYICKYEVTQGLWKEVMGTDNNPSANKGDDLPVTNITGRQITVFFMNLEDKTTNGKYTYSLPKEPEWEYAARGGALGAGRKYSGSDDVAAVAWYDHNSGVKTHPVGTKEANELGIHDMSGNVWEVVLVGTSNRAERGGSYFGNGKVDYCRVTYRKYLVSADGVTELSDRGFRIAATLK